MNLGIDGRGAVWYRGTGIGTYTWRLLAELEKDEHCEILLPGMELRDIRFGEATSLEIHNKDGIWERSFLPQTIKEKKIDLYHVPQNGLGLPAVKGCKQTVTIHDMIPYMFPETVGRGYLREFLGAMPRIMAESDGIIAVSEASKRDILALFDYPEENIRVIAEAPEPIYHPIPKEAAAAVLFEKYGITEDFILYVGGFGLRKNVKALLLAYYLLRKEENLSWHLVLPGKRSAEFDRLDAVVEALDLKDYVHFCGYVPVAELPYFYAAAEVMAYPSLYEGFGLPPLEAMAAGCPVLSSNASSLPEVLGDAALYFDPLDTVALAEKLRSLYTNPQKRRDLRRKGEERVKAYSWEKTAKETLDFFEDIYTT